MATEKVEQAKAPALPARVTDRRAWVTGSNTRLKSGGDILVSRFKFPPKPSVYTVHSGKERFAARLDKLFRAGKAAGNHGGLYDKRVCGHSNFSRNAMP